MKFRYGKPAAPVLISPSGTITGRVFSYHQQHGDQCKPALQRYLLWWYLFVYSCHTFGCRCLPLHSESLQ
jgi:hypothetical protein